MNILTPSMTGFSPFRTVPRSGAIYQRLTTMGRAGFPSLMATPKSANGSAQRQSTPSGSISRSNRSTPSGKRITSGTKSERVTFTGVNPCKARCACGRQSRPCPPVKTGMETDEPTPDRFDIFAVVGAFGPRAFADRLSRYTIKYDALV